MPIVERTFLGWDAPALALAAEHLAAHYADERELRLDDAIVVLPGARAGRRLLELLLDRATSRGVPLVPPQVTTIGRLPELVYTPEASAPEPLLARLAWARALRELDSARVASLFPYPPEATDVVGWATLGATLATLHREVGGAGLSFADVPARLAGLPFDDRARWEVLAALDAAYHEQLAVVQRRDREAARRHALEAGALACTRDVWLVGVAEMPALVRRMLVACPAPVRALVHAPAARADAFDELGCVLCAAWLEAEVPLQDDRLRLADRPAGQADAAVAAIAELAAGRLADDVVVGVPDVEVVPYLEDRLAAVEVPARAAEGLSLTRTSPYRLLDALGRYLEGRRFDALAALLRHPAIGNWLARRQHEQMNGSRAAAAADVYFERHLPADLVGGVLEGGATEVRLANVVHALETGLVKALAGERRLSEWAQPLMDVLVQTFGEDVDRGRAADRQLLAACTRLRASAATLAALPGHFDVPVRAPQAIRLLLSDVEPATVPPESDGAAVELLGWLELHLDDAPVLVLTGVNEGSLPKSIAGDAFLPDALRTRLGLVDNDARYARDVYLLNAVLSTRPDTVVVSGRRGVAGDPLRPSRLLFAASGPTIIDRVLRFYGGEAAPAVAPAAANGSGASAFTVPLEPVIERAKPLDVLHVTDFKGLLEDPYAFALQHILGLEPVDDAATELDPLGFGTLAHEVLHQFGKSDHRALTDARALRTVFDELLDTLARKRFGARALPSVYLQLEQLRVRLHAFAEWQVQRMREGWRIEAVEVSPPEPGMVRDVDGEPFCITGRVDRVDYHPERDEWAVFDYKTSEKGDGPEKTHQARPRTEEDEKRAVNGKVWVDLQLPLYRELLPHLVRKDGSPVVPPGVKPVPQLGYIVLPGRDVAGEHALVTQWSDEELNQALKDVDSVIRLVRANRYAFDPARVRAARAGDLAALVGVGQLADLDDEDEEGGEE